MATDQSTVEYRDIPGFPGYRIGNDGTVWTCWRGHGIKELGTVWKPMKGNLVGGHFQISLFDDDGNPINNALTNLRWDTKKSNMADQVKHGVRIQGETHPLAKLNPDKVREVRRAAAEGESKMSISRRLQVSHKTIRNILNGLIWKDVI